MGGLATLLGSPPNAIVAGYAADELGRNIGFFEWMMLGLPLAFTFILIGWVLMTRVLYRFDIKEIPGWQEMIEGEIHKLGPLSQSEKMVMIVFVSAAFLWVVPGLLATIPVIEENAAWLGRLDDTAIAVAAGIAMFILPGRGRNEIVPNWRDAEDGLPWGALLLFGGGLSLAGAAAASGLDEWFSTADFDDRHPCCTAARQSGRSPQPRTRMTEFEQAGFGGPKVGDAVMSTIHLRRTRHGTGSRNAVPA